MVAVKYLRQRGLKYREVSEITGFAEQNLRLWDKGYDGELQRQKEEHPGGSRSHNFQVTAGFIEFIVGTAREFLSQQKRRKRLRIRSFLRYLNKVHRDQVAFLGCGKSRRVITDTLGVPGWLMGSMKRGSARGNTPATSQGYPATAPMPNWS